MPTMAFLARFACLFWCEFVGMTALVGSVPTFACDFALALRVHGSKAALAASFPFALALLARTALLFPVRVFGSHFNSPFHEKLQLAL